MIIPARFKLLGETITVRYDADLNLLHDSFGQARYRKNEIVIQPNVDGCPRTVEQLDQTFCHELVHHILYAGGEDEFEPPLHRREFFVDRLASLLHQALTTMEYDNGTR